MIKPDQSTPIPLRAFCCPPPTHVEEDNYLIEDLTSKRSLLGVILLGLLILFCWTFCGLRQNPENDTKYSQTTILICFSVYLSLLFILLSLPLLCAFSCCVCWYLWCGGTEQSLVEQRERAGPGTERSSL